MFCQFGKVPHDTSHLASCRFGDARASGNDAVMQPHSIKIVQTSLETGRERAADLCWSSLVMISDRTRGRKSPSEVLDAMLWGDKVLTIRFA
jgi:hypothetical protein